jgi:hypothetical protein
MYINVSKEVIQIFPEHIFIVNTFIFLFSSYLIGYISRLAPPRLLDRMTVILASVGTEKKFMEAWKHPWNEKEQPFDFIFDPQNKKLKNMYKGCNTFCSKTRDFKMFFICKQIIHQYSPTLWLEAERREAEVRFINGLFYPTLFVSFIFFFGTNIVYGLFFLALSVFLLLAFRRRRYAEVSFALIATFVILKDRNRKK